MSKAFSTEVSPLEKELAVLITLSKVQARIDSHNKVIPANADSQVKGA
jgi:hypothetical protein